MRTAVHNVGSAWSSGAADTLVTLSPAGTSRGGVIPTIFGGDGFSLFLFTSYPQRLKVELEAYAAGADSANGSWSLIAPPIFDGTTSGTNSWRVDEFTPPVAQKLRILTTSMEAATTINEISRTGGVVTVLTVAAHGLTVGQSVAVISVGQPGVSGTYTVATVPGASTFTYAKAGADFPVDALGGTVTPRTSFKHLVKWGG